MVTTRLRLELRFGGRYLVRDGRLRMRLVAKLRRNETMTEEAIEALQLRALHRTLLAAAAKLPYYRHVPKRFCDADSKQVLREFVPVVAKETLLEHPDELYPNRGKRQAWHAVGKTSGTTGTPLCVLRSLNSVRMENAFLTRHWAWGGYTDGVRRATLRGDLVTPVERTHPPFWFWNRYNNQLLISSRHLKEAFADAIIDELDRFSPRMLQAYPSTAYVLAQMLAKRNRRLRIPVAFIASEPLYSHQRELIEDRFEAKVMDMYGMAERVALATECEAGSMHVNPDYSYVEIVDDHGRPTDGFGYVVGTTFHNLAMPLLRYRLSDRTRWIPGRCRCGRAFPMIEPVTGKWEDTIFGADGESVSPSVLTFAFKGVRNIGKSQVAQIGAGHWQIRLVPLPAFGGDDCRKLIDNIHELVDRRIRVDVVVRPEIASTEAGKFRWVVNEWSPADVARIASGNARGSVSLCAE